MFCVGNEICDGAELPSVYFITNNLYSPDPAVSCVADKQVSHLEINTFCSTLLHFI